VEKAGACLVELDNEPNDLWNKVESLLFDAGKLEKMAAAAKGLGMPDAADQIAKAILEKENA
jgi:UDP-N-acetylglucosamine--N-acetylmuramyl-(pentapeptide) pyrophosphoryl-undecaprenol N-acetylglucosamine transferase